MWELISAKISRHLNIDPHHKHGRGERFTVAPNVSPDRREVGSRLGPVYAEVILMNRKGDGTSVASVADGETLPECVVRSPQ